MLLVTEQQVIDAMNLTSQDVQEALNRHPMTTPDWPVATAVFQGMSPSGDFVYRVTYVDEDGEVIHINTVSLHYSRSALSTDYLMFAKV